MVQSYSKLNCFLGVVRIQTLSDVQGMVLLITCELNIYPKRDLGDYQAKM